MLVRLLITVIVLWALFTFTESIVGWGAYFVGFVLDHVQITIS